MKKQWSIRVLFYFFFIYFLVWFIWGFIDWYSAGILNDLESYTLFFFFEEVFDSLLIIFLILYIFKKWTVKLKDVGIVTNHLVKNIFIGMLLGLFLSEILFYINVFMISQFGEGPIEHYLVKAIREAKGGLALSLFALIACVFVPVSEELLYRGFVYNVFKRNFRRLSLAIIITALVFIILHINPVWFPSLFLISIGLTILYEYTGSLIGPIVAHSVINSMVFIIK